MNWHQRNQFQAIIRNFITIGRYLAQKNFIAANEGNLSNRFENYFLATETGAALGRLEPTNILVVDENGNQVVSPYHRMVQTDSKVTSEWKMHFEIYRKRTDVQSVIHSHPPFATAWSITQTDFPTSFLAETALILKKVKTIPFALPGSTDLAEQVANALVDTNVVLLANHGVVSVGSTLFQAYENLERLEHSVKTVMIALFTKQAKELSVAQLNLLKNFLTELDK